MKKIGMKGCGSVGKGRGGEGRGEERESVGARWVESRDGRDGRCGGKKSEGEGEESSGYVGTLNGELKIATRSNGPGSG